jgi:endonuclease/exonuclease/phosphatase family metal-dependent hydrolase
MAKNNETYNSDLGAPSRRRKRTYIGTILFIVHLALTISLSVALIIAYLTPYVSPQTFGSLTIVGIFAPILFISVVACLLVWLIAREWKVAGAVALVLIPGLFHMSQFYNASIFRSSDVVSNDPQSFTILSYNVRGFYDDNGKRTIDSYVDYIVKSDAFSKKEKPADVICIQEFALGMPETERLDSLLEVKMGKLNVYQTDESEYVALRTYSRYDIVDAGSISGSNRGTSHWVDIVRGDDTIRVFNNHLYTMSISEHESDEISRGKILSDGDRVKSIIDRVAQNSTIRMGHVDTLRHVINATPYKHVVVGDFNDTPMSYVYNTLSEDLYDAFSEQGSGFGYTYRPMWGLLRIDYILYSEGFEALNYKADNEVLLSDHLPVVARLKFSKEKDK